MYLNLSALNNLPLHFAAQQYALHGFRVLPLQPGAKTPLPTVRWGDEATDDLRQVAAWWGAVPDANIGIVLGDGFHVLDLDRKNGENGFDSYLAAGGTVPIPYPIQRTPSNGLHLLFRDLELDLKNSTRLGEHGGLDLRTGGRGYIVASPSVLADGKRYAWADGDPDVPLPATLRQTLVQWAGRSEQPSVITAVRDVVPSDLQWPQVEERLQALKPVNRSFLETGEGPTGDRSRDAYLACYDAFVSGWTLEDMAAIGPDTVLGSFGAEAPHLASNPWAWCWKYTVMPAWNAAAGRRMVFQQVRSEISPEGDPSNHAAPGPGEGNIPSVDPYQELVAQIGRLGAPVARHAGAAQAAEPALDVGKVEAILLNALEQQLPESRLELLLAQLKQATKTPITTLRQLLRELRHRVRTLTKAGQETQSAQEVYVKDQAKFFDRNSGKLISMEAFRTTKAREFGGNMDAALDHYVHGAHATCELVDTLTYHPGKPSGIIEVDGVRLYNLYEPSPQTPVAGDVRPWLSLLEALQFEDGVASQEHLLDWMAWTVQHPECKINHGILLGGKHGIGKDSFVAPLVRAVGIGNTVTVDGDELQGSFNGWAARCKLAILNELDMGTFREKNRIAGLIKPMLAAPPETLRVNEKNLRQYEIPNLLSCLGFTNHRGALHAESGDRRWCAIWCQSIIPETGEIAERWAQWFREYWGWLESGGFQAVHAWLLARDLKMFNPAARPPKTEWMRQMEFDSEEPLHQWLSEALAEKRGCFGLEVADFETIMHDLMRVAPVMFGGRMPHRNRVSAALSSLGLRVARSRRVDGTQRRLWVLRGTEVTEVGLAGLRRYRNMNNLSEDTGHG